jgi:sphingomyelin phosphodiesterase
MTLICNKNVINFRGAYYSVRVKPGLKLISLNMNYCNNQNWWLLLNSTDPTGQLEWLIRELQASELTEEKVEIQTFINLLKLF